MVEISWQSYFLEKL